MATWSHGRQLHGRDASLASGSGPLQGTLTATVPGGSRHSPTWPTARPRRSRSSSPAEPWRVRRQQHRGAAPTTPPSSATRSRPIPRRTARARSSWASSSSRRSPATSPASASTRGPATPAPTSATSGPAPARCWPRRPSPARPPAAGSRSPSHAGADHGQHHLRRLVLLARGALRRQQQLLHHAA